MLALVEVALEAVQHVVGGCYPSPGGGFGGADRAVAGATQEHHRPLARCDACRDEIVDEGLVAGPVDAAPFDVDDIALQRRKIRLPDNAPPGARPATDHQ